MIKYRLIDRLKAMKGSSKQVSLTRESVVGENRLGELLNPSWS